jgi:predicted dehydrogenase
MSKLAASVIGAGVFGAIHAKKYAENDAVELKGVYDPDYDAAKRVAHPLGVAALLHMTGAMAASDLVTIASPAVHHGRTALMAVLAGCHIYVEKPLATDMETAEKILAEAARRNLVVAVGHQERAVFEAMGVLDIDEQPTQFHAVRKGTPSERNRDVSATLDLMIHDIDLALALTDGEPVTVEGDGDDNAATAEVTFDNGFFATFAVSRVNPNRERTTRIVYPSGEVVIDFLTRTFTNTTPHKLNADFALTPAGKDPLGASVNQFLDAVQGNSPRPLVTGEEAAEALGLALAVEQSLGA